MGVCKMTKQKPLYQTIYEELYKKISSSTYDVGSYLPSESELQKTYGVSRITVRRVLTDLEQDGFIKKIKGKGSVVLPKKKYSDLYELTGFSEDAKRNGCKPSSIIIKNEMRPASVTVAQFLQVEPEEDVFYLERLRLLNGRISGVFITYISTRFNLPLEPDQFDSDTSLYDFYEKNNVHLGDASETIEAIMTTPEIRKSMFLDKDEPIFYRERITYNEINQPIEYSKNYYRANGYKYVVRMHRDR